MRSVVNFRGLLGGLSVVTVLYCCFVIFSAWVLVPDWPGKTPAQNFATRAEFPPGALVVGTGFAFLARWCLAKRKPF